MSKPLLIVKLVSTKLQLKRELLAKEAKAFLDEVLCEIAKWEP